MTSEKMTMRSVIFLVLLGGMPAPAALADPNLDAPLLKDIGLISRLSL
jgi:hypothetical protein